MYLGGNTWSQLATESSSVLQLAPRALAVLIDPGLFNWVVVCPNHDTFWAFCCSLFRLPPLALRGGSLIESQFSCRCRCCRCCRCRCRCWCFSASFKMHYVPDDLGSPNLQEILIMAKEHDVTKKWSQLVTAGHSWQQKSRF